MSPRERIEKASRVYGGESVALWCAELLSGQVSHDADDRPPLTWLGGPHAEVLLGYDELGRHEYWPRVWGARGLLYTWSPRAQPAVLGALEDSAWRVREMALKVVRKRELGEACDAAAALTADEVPRVRVAAVRALALVGEGEHAQRVRDVLDDPESLVRNAALSAIETLGRRLERPL